MARRLGLEVETIEGDWRSGVDAEAIEEALSRDVDAGAAPDPIRAVAVLHNETSSGAASDVPAVRRALDGAGHPALLFVDTISSLASMPYEHDGWGVDVTVAGSQKGLMLPPGLGFNAVSEKAWHAGADAKLARSYWDWRAMDAPNETGYFPFTPATNLLFGLKEAVAMLEEEGMERVFDRHRRLAAATRRAVQAWGLDFNCLPPEHRSASLTAVRMPEGFSADALRALILERFDVSLGNGLGEARRPGVPHRPPRRSQRRDPPRHPRGGGDGARARGRALPAGRGRCGDGPPRRLSGCHCRFVVAAVSVTVPFCRRRSE